MDTVDYDPRQHLYQLFDSPELLDEISELLAYTNHYKHQLDAEINDQINKYNSERDDFTVRNNVEQLIEMIKKVKSDSADTQRTISSMTSSIQQLDQYKKNLVLSMTVLQRLQMMISANNTLISIIPTRNYENILQSLSVIKELLTFFQPYKSIDEINQLSLTVMKSQHKLVDDIFTDFEEFVNNKYDHEEQLKFGCEILQLIDPKYQQKLLTWYYNYQLKDIKVIFNNYDEAGSLENLSRRYIYFNNILSTVQATMNTVFPQSWHVDLEFSKLFCQLTKTDLNKLLSSKRNGLVNSQTILDNLHHTLDFERSLEEKFKSPQFNQIISSVFEPYLTIWVQEQDKVLQSKFVEYVSTSQLPSELSNSKTQQEFMTILKVNTVPNIASSSIDLFKTFQKILTQILKLSNGAILVDLCQLFIKYFFEYHTRVLLPILPSNEEDLLTLEAIKYITMLLNTGDYIINNIDDLSDKFLNLIQPQFKPRIPSFDSIKDVYYRLINRSISCLITKISENLKPVWRQFVNQNWQQLDSVTDISTYMQDLTTIVKENNIMLTLPLIIRESYVRNVCDKTVELVINSLANNLLHIKPLKTVMLQQILLDIDIFKSVALTFTLYSDANYGSKVNDQEYNHKGTSKSYTKFVNTQFGMLESLLKLLMVPNEPVENLIEQYFLLIKDSSISNFMKVLKLKSVDYNSNQKYLENFKLQLTIENDLLVKSSSLLANMEEEKIQRDSHEASATPEIKSPNLLPINKINLNIEKGFRDFAINGENNISKFNENFKNFGKFFRKEDR